MKFKIRKILVSDVKSEYIETINNAHTKKFIKFAKQGKKTKSKNDLVNYIKKLPKNELLYVFILNKKHLGNFKFSIIKKKIYIGFLVFNKYQGKGLLKKIFPQIIKLFSKNFPNYKRLYLGVSSKNIRAISLYRKIGFRFNRYSSKTMSLKIR